MTPEIIGKHWNSYCSLPRKGTGIPLIIRNKTWSKILSVAEHGQACTFFPFPFSLWQPVWRWSFSSPFSASGFIHFFSRVEISLFTMRIFFNLFSVPLIIILPLGPEFLHKQAKARLLYRVKVLSLTQRVHTWSELPEMLTRLRRTPLSCFHPF